MGFHYILNPPRMNVNFLHTAGFSIRFFARGQTPALGGQILSFCIDFMLVRIFEAARKWFEAVILASSRLQMKTLHTG